MTAPRLLPGRGVGNSRVVYTLLPVPQLVTAPPDGDGEPLFVL
jgi:hypothetical protein